MIGYQLWLMAVTSPDAIYTFYEKLARRRATDNSRDETSEYVESYRHLREHGNAFAIILVEGSLTLTLLSTRDVYSFIGALVAWILPCACIWPLGTWLESKDPPRKSGP